MKYYSQGRFHPRLTGQHKSRTSLESPPRGLCYLRQAEKTYSETTWSTKSREKNPEVKVCQQHGEILFSLVSLPHLGKPCYPRQAVTHSPRLPVNWLSLGHNNTLRHKKFRGKRMLTAWWNTIQSCIFTKMPKIDEKWIIWRAQT